MAFVALKCVSVSTNCCFIQFMQLFICEWAENFNTTLRGKSLFTPVDVQVDQSIKRLQLRKWSFTSRFISVLRLSFTTQTSMNFRFFAYFFSLFLWLQLLICLFSNAFNSGSNTRVMWAIVDLDWKENAYSLHVNVAASNDYVHATNLQQRSPTENHLWKTIVQTKFLVQFLERFAKVKKTKGYTGIMNI